MHVALCNQVSSGCKMCSLTSKTDLSFPLAVPLSVMHRAINDTELQGYKIPQGSIIIPLLYSASYDPKYWVDAETFNPDRFINTTGKLIKNDALMPFSVGKYNPANIQCWAIICPPTKRHLNGVSLAG